MKNKNRILPIILTLLLLVVIVYLFVNIKQPYVECEKTTTNDLNISIKENLTTTFSHNKIAKMKLTKTIILPVEYQKEETINYIKKALQKAYKYIENSTKIVTSDNNIIVEIEIEDDETIILNNIEFIKNPNLEIKINPNTKSSDVLTLKIKDKYTEGEFMTHLKNNGYVCK